MIRKLFHSKLNRLLFMAFVLLAVPLLIINLLITTHSMNVTRKEISNTYTNTLRLTADQFSDRLRDLELLASSLSIDDQLNAMCIVEKGAEDLYDYVLFHDRMRGYANQRIMTSNISVLLPKQQWIISTKNRIARTSTYEEFDSYAREIPHYGSWGIRRSLYDPQRDCFSIVCGYVNERQSNAIFIVEIGRQEILEALSGLSASSEVANVFLVDGEGHIYAQDESLFAQQELVDAVRDAFADREKKQYELVHENDRQFYRVIGQTLQDNQCVMGVVIDEQAILEPLVATRQWAYAAVLCFMIAIALYMRISYRRITEPIEDIKTVMKRVEDGDFTARAHGFHQNEIGEITIALNHMIEQLDGLIKERYLSNMQLTQTQMKFLRAQIRPHFLYNCLYTIYTLIKNEDLDSAANLAIYLGQYYQINTRSENAETPLYQEIEHIRLLIRIQRMRFGDILTYEEAIDDELRLLQIPSLALLTIVENFLTHGLKSQSAAALLRIEAERGDAGAVLRVVDTGIGMEEDRLNDIQKSIDRAEPDQTDAHGLQNVAIRFRMLYGDAARLTIERNEPHGLIVRICVPKGAD